MTEPTTASETILTEQDDTLTKDLAEILRGLSMVQKSLSPKFFYDERGSALFDAICELPEYYPTRTELQIMRSRIGEIAARVGPRASVIEFGSGSSRKTRILLEHLDDLAAYVPVDISRDHLLAAAQSIAADFPAIEILPVAADFTRPFPLPNPRIEPQRNLVYFPGSTIGNFSLQAAHELLRVMHQEAGENGALLIGVDLKKDPRILERAYNDGAGVTADFNLNLLSRLNREFGADFDLDRFRHRAIWNAAAGRIEMHLVSLCEQRVHVGGRAFEFAADEFIVTEYSHKYTLEQFNVMATGAGFRVIDAWTDPRKWFSVQFCLRNE
ncbi:MAG: L-histidine N(alpha)-methyltransferase [Xanthomonadales bacterium]|nr:L-histidine N(alpha)-methyltransferase [Xanthomonadales bacterium]